MIASPSDRDRRHVEQKGCEMKAAQRAAEHVLRVADERGDAAGVRARREREQERQPWQLVARDPTDHDRRDEDADRIVRHDRREDASAPHGRADEATSRPRPSDYALTCAVEEAVEREECAHPHDREEKDDRRVINRVRCLVGGQRAKRDSEHGADERAGRPIHFNEP